LPLSDGFGLGRLRCSMLAGVAVILVEGFIYPENIFRAFEDHKASGFCCVPSGFASLFQITGDKLGEYGHQLKYVETATAPLPSDVKERLLRILPQTRVFNTYGLTETTATIAFVELRASQQEPIPVGRPVPGVEIRIADEHERPVSVGALGLVLIRGDNVMKGYWRDPARTQDVLIEGWLRTNDIGFLDAEGYLYLKGRKEELINVGGLKVAPIEIERVLEKHAAVKECACIGISDPASLMGEAIKAFLVPKFRDAARPANDELIKFLRNIIEAYKIPSQFVWVDELPKTPVGKLQRLRLRERADSVTIDDRIKKKRLKLEDLIRQTFSLPAEYKINETDGPGSLDGWDSLGHARLILAIEYEYDVNVQPAEAMKVERVSDLTEILRNKGLANV
jgi:long-chain acyl-CoA synthetase